MNLGGGAVFMKLGCSYLLQAGPAFALVFPVRLPRFAGGVRLSRFTCRLAFVCINGDASPGSGSMARPVRGKRLPARIEW